MASFCAFVMVGFPDGMRSGQECHAAVRASSHRKLPDESAPFLALGTRPRFVLPARLRHVARTAQRLQVRERVGRAAVVKRADVIDFEPAGPAARPAPPGRRARDTRTAPPSIADSSAEDDAGSTVPLHQCLKRGVLDLTSWSLATFIVLKGNPRWVKPRMESASSAVSRQKSRLIRVSQPGTAAIVAVRMTSRRRTDPYSSNGSRIRFGTRG